MTRAIKKILRYTGSLTKTEFEADDRTQDAVIRQFQILGDAAKKVSSAFQQQHREIPWSSMARMRDVLVHNYADVDLDIVWETLQTSLPDLLPLLQPLLDRRSE